MASPTDTPSTLPTTAPAPSPSSSFNDMIAGPTTMGQVAYAIFTTVATGALIYHGAKRNDSIGWGLGWGLLPNVIGLPIALYQGFGQPRADPAPSGHQALETPPAAPPISRMTGAHPFAR